MARLRYNGLTTTLGASLTSSATSVTFGAALTHSGGTAVPTITGSDYIPLTILTSAGAVSEIVYLTAYTSGATTGTITRGQESTSGVAHSSGDKVIHSTTVQDVGNRYARMVCATTGQNVSVSSTSLAVLTHNGNEIKVTVGAEAGDVLQLGLNCQLNDAVSAYVDFGAATFNGSSQLNMVPTAASGSIAGWGFRNYETYAHLATTCRYVVQASDVISGQVTVKLMGFQSGGARSLMAEGAPPLIFDVKNFGQ